MQHYINIYKYSLTKVYSNIYQKVKIDINRIICILLKYNFSKQ